MPPKKTATSRATSRRKPMSDNHKKALAEGRDQGRAVRRYLEALEAHKPKRGRKRTPESVQKRLKTIDQRLPDADPLSRVLLIQERMDLEQELAQMTAKVDLPQLEKDFVRAARSYGARKGITYAAWREAGVDPGVLRKAGINRAAGS